MGGICNTHREMRNVYKILVVKPEEKRPLGIPRRIWEYNIKMDFKEIGRVCMNWIRLTEDRDHW
jgi:hypothetical protein